MFRSGWAHAWHYDESEFTVTLSLVQAAEGGAFEFTEPLRRSVDDLAFETTAAVINDHSEYAVEPAGAACPPSGQRRSRRGPSRSFAGRTSLHRVSEVKGERARRGVRFSDIEGFVNSPEVQRMFWGRAVRPDCDLGLLLASRKNASSTRATPRPICPFGGGRGPFGRHVGQPVCASWSRLRGGA